MRQPWARLLGAELWPYLQRGRVRVLPLAARVMDSIAEADRQRIVEEVAALPPGGPEQWPPHRTYRLENGEQGRYLLTVPPEYRVFLHASPDGVIFIHDVLTEEALRALGPEDVGEGAAG